MVTAVGETLAAVTASEALAFFAAAGFPVRLHSLCTLL